LQDQKSDSAQIWPILQRTLRRAWCRGYSLRLREHSAHVLSVSASGVPRRGRYTTGAHGVWVIPLKTCFEKAFEVPGMKRGVTSRRAVAPKSMVAPESGQECVRVCSTSHVTDGQRHRTPESKHEAHGKARRRVSGASSTSAQRVISSAENPAERHVNDDPGWSRVASEIWRVIGFSGLLTDTPRLQSYPSLGTLTTTIYGFDLWG
jgi:hypothetical protein